MQTPSHSSSNPPSNADWQCFLDADRDNDELRAVAIRARIALANAEWPVKRFSDLLDEVLPADPSQQERIARAIAISSGELDALRRHRMDPLAADLFALVNLAREFGLREESFRALLFADHLRFADSAANARGDDELTTWSALNAAWSRLREENPARFSALDREKE